jgi:hypothetical protein
MAGESEEPVEVVFENGGREVEHASEEGAWRLSSRLLRRGHLFRLSRREVVSRSGERTHLRITYKDTGDG